MRKTGHPNLNSKRYWDELYRGGQKRAEYTQVTAGANGNSQRFATALKEIKDGDKVLDLGCGIGIFTSMVKETYPDCDVWGVDISQAAIDENQKLHKNINYRQGYIGSLDLVVEDSFDVVFAGEVLEHLDDPDFLFSDAHRALKPGGKLIITTPLEEAIQSEEHTWYFSKADVEQLYEDNGFAFERFVDLPDMEWALVIFAVGRKA